MLVLKKARGWESTAVGESSLLIIIMLFEIFYAQQIENWWFNYGGKDEDDPDISFCNIYFFTWSPDDDDDDYPSSKPDSCVTCGEELVFHSVTTNFRISYSARTKDRDDDDKEAKTSLWWNTKKEAKPMNVMKD